MRNWTLRQAISEGQGFRSPPHDDLERRQKAYAVAEFQRATGWPDELLNTQVDELADRFIATKVET